MFDPGEGTQRQMIFTDVTASSLTRILVSHFHADHCLGLAGVCQRISLDRVPHPVEVHFPASGQAYFDRLRRASIYHAAGRLEPRPVDDAELEGVRVLHEDSALRLLAAPLDHAVSCLGFRLEERPRRTMLPERLREAGIRGPAIKTLQREGAVVVDGREITLEEMSVPRPGQAVAVLMDSRPCRAAHELAEGADLLLASATYLERDRAWAERRKDRTALEAARLARSAGVKKLVLTHFDPMYERLEPFLEEASRLFADVALAEDGARFPVPRPKKP
jgi:ribonuclease Z